MLSWIQEHRNLGIAIYIGIGVPWVTMCLPGSLLSLCAGVAFTKAFGPVGVLMAWLAGITNHFVAGQLSFYVARYLLYGLLRPYFERQKMLKSIERALLREGYKISFLLRSAAFFPYMILNYGLALTSIKPSQYMFGFLGGWPWEALIIYYGYCVGDIISILDGSYKSGIQLFLMLIDVSHSAFIVATVCCSMCIGVYIVSLTFREIRKLNDAASPQQPIEMVEENIVVTSQKSSTSTD